MKQSTLCAYPTHVRSSIFSTMKASSVLSILFPLAAGSDQIIRFVRSQEQDVNFTTSQGLRALIKVREGRWDDFLQLATDFARDRQIATNITKRGILALRISNMDVLDRIASSELVEHAELDGVLSTPPGGDGNAFSVQGDSSETTPYGIIMVQADQLWDIPEVDTTLQICVVDTGYNAGHPDLPSVFADGVTGTSTEAGLWARDVNGHGTHTSGTIGAIGGNGIGVVGIRKNPNLNIFHASRGLGNDGSGFSSTIMAAVQGCVDSGARVISMALGGPSNSATERRFYQDIYDEGILIVAAAGNSGDTGDLYPASYPVVMSVAAVDENGNRPGFSQCNSQVEIAAPGVDILSTFPPSTYARSSGTSMACPHVAGVAAQLLAIFPNCTNYQIRNVMLKTAKPVGSATGCNRGYGNGLVQGKAAYDMLMAGGCTAGGDTLEVPSSAVVGGCEQNPDYISSENPNRDVCVDAANPRITLVSLTVLISIWGVHIIWSSLW